MLMLLLWIEGLTVLISKSNRGRPYGWGLRSCLINQDDGRCSRAIRLAPRHSQTWDIAHQRLPCDLVFDAMIDMGHENAVRSDFVPWYLRYHTAHFFGNLVGSIADPINDRLTRKTQEAVAIPCVDPPVNDLSSIGSI